MAQTWLPSVETSTDCAGLRRIGSLLTDFQVAPWSFETSTPPAVAAYQVSVPKAMSFTRNAASCVFAAGAAGAFFTGAPFLPLVVLVAAAGASGAYKPARTHLCVVSSYFIQPPLVSDAHQPLGA